MTAVGLLINENNGLSGFDLAESVVRDELTSEGRIQAQVSFQYGTDRAMFKRVDGGTSGSGST